VGGISLLLTSALPSRLSTLKVSQSCSRPSRNVWPEKLLMRTRNGTDSLRQELLFVELNLDADLRRRGKPATSNDASTKRIFRIRAV
jgi:hypothetical protein